MRRGLKGMLTALGTVAMAAGGHDLVRGVEGIRGRDRVAVDPSVDSELRFFAAWYVVAGIGMLRAARAPEREGPAVQLISAGWLAAAVGRLLSRRAAGRPHPLYEALTVAEVVIAATLPPWQRRVATAARPISLPDEGEASAPGRGG